MGTADFALQNKICGNCLRVFRDEYPLSIAVSRSTGLCPACKGRRDTAPHDKKRLFAKQLKLFLSYKTGKRPLHGPDVLAMYSGGTDSALALYYARVKLGLRVLALKFNMAWERPGIDKKSEEFCLKYRIPLITVRSDLKTMFLKRYRDLDTVDDETIIRYPWCGLCSEGDESFVWWGAGQVAELLQIDRIVTGNNMDIVAGAAPRIGDPVCETEYFWCDNARWLYPVRVLDRVSGRGLMINLPVALGVTKKKKLQTLSKIGYALPHGCFRTSGSDCSLGLVLPCAAKALDPGQQVPKASAYAEFLSGYITREEWLEALVRVNSFSKEDAAAAVRFMRKTLSDHEPGNGTSVDLNRYAEEQLKHIDIRGFKDELSRRMRVREHIVHAQYFLGMRKLGMALREAQQAVDAGLRDPSEYRCLGAFYTQAHKSGNAVKLYDQALRLYPRDGAMYVGSARAWYDLHRYAEGVAAAQKAVRLGYKRFEAYFIEGLCYERRGQYAAAAKAFRAAGDLQPDDPRIPLALARCYRRIGRELRADKEMRQWHTKVKQFSMAWKPV